MNFSLYKRDLIIPLQAMSIISCKKHIVPIFSNILCEIVDYSTLRMIAANSETEIIVNITVHKVFELGRLILPTKKLISIIHNFHDNSLIQIYNAKDSSRLCIKSDLSKFVFSFLDDPNSFPLTKIKTDILRCKVSRLNLLSLIKRVQFSMAYNDVRRSLNGMLWVIRSNTLKAISTDGHRMSISEINLAYVSSDITLTLIISRESINEFQKVIRLCKEEEINLFFYENYFRVKFSNYNFTSRLVDDDYPDYLRVIPKDNKNLLVINKLIFKQALTRMSVLSNNMSYGVRLKLLNNKLSLFMNNQENEEAEDEIQLNYKGNNIEMCFNIHYLLDVVNAINSININLYFDKCDVSVIFKDEILKSLYVVSPMRVIH